MKRFLLQPFLFLFPKKKAIRNYTLQQMTFIIDETRTPSQLADIKTVFMWCGHEFPTSEFKQVVFQIHYREQLFEILAKSFKFEYYPAIGIKNRIEAADRIIVLDGILLHLQVNREKYLKYAGKDMIDCYRELIEYRKNAINYNFKNPNPQLV